MLKITLYNQETTPQANAIFADGFCKNNQNASKRLGGYHVIRNGALLASVEKDGGTNNLWELRAIAAALKFVKPNTPTVIYSDSEVALRWLINRTVGKKVQDPQVVIKGINFIYKYIEENNLDVEIRLWKSNEWGAIPADDEVVKSQF